MRARTVALVETVDLNDIAGGDGFLFVRDGVGMAGRGVAARIPADRASALLAGIDHDDRVGGVSPRAIGSIAFTPGLAADLVVPVISVVKHADGRQWVTIVADDAHGLDDAGADVSLRRALTAPVRPQPVAQAEAGAREGLDGEDDHRPDEQDGDQRRRTDADEPADPEG